jgi:outer membrane protein assembly factor BamB
MNTLRFLIALGVILCLAVSAVIALAPANTAQAQPADGPWPMFRQNAQHTGRSPYSCPAGIPYEKWSVQTKGWVYSSPAIGADGTIYLGSGDGALYAINPDGTIKWRFWTEDEVHSSPAIGIDGTIYVGSRDNNFYAINWDGTEKWRVTSIGDFESSPVIDDDGTIYIAGYDGYLYALDRNRSEKWSPQTVGHSNIAPSPAIAADGKTIYVATNSLDMYAIDAYDGSQKWHFPAGSWSSPAIGADGTIYVGSHDKKLYAINPDGTHSWNFTTGDEIPSSPAIAADGTIYVGSYDGYLYAINRDGSPSWNFTTGHPVLSSPAIGADGTIYIGAYNDKLYAINPDGTEKWSFATGNAIFSSPAIGADGTIYVGCADGKLYAITAGYTLTIPVPYIGGPIPGSVEDPGWGTFTYEGGTVVDLVAKATQGYSFVEWTGDVDTIANVYAAETTITMEGNYEIAASFEELPDPIPHPDIPDIPTLPGDGSCFIATAAYGTPMAEEIEILREFRDEYLLTNPVGQALVDVYYRVSPPLAEFITEHPGLKPVVRAGLLPALAMSTVTVNTSSAQKMAIIGLVVLVSVALALWANRRRSRGTQYT